MTGNSDRTTIDILQEMVSHAKQLILLDALEQVIQATKVKTMADYASAVALLEQRQKELR